jgi:hypothetical protein
MSKPRRVFEQEGTEVAEKGFLRSVLSVCFCSILFLLVCCSSVFAHQELLKRYVVSIERPQPVAEQKKLAEAK